MDTKAAILHYCNYQERCHKEVRNKLYELGCYKEEVELLISELVISGVVSEERYAKAYARGKFRMLKWGKTKIIQQLRINKISEYCIKKALKEIDEGEYEKTLGDLAKKKLKDLKGQRSGTAKKSKLYSFLVQKGYESKRVLELINEIIKSA